MEKWGALLLRPLAEFMVRAMAADSEEIVKQAVLFWTMAAEAAHGEADPAMRVSEGDRACELDHAE